MYLYVRLLYFLTDTLIILVWERPFPLCAGHAPLGPTPSTASSNTAHDGASEGCYGPGGGGEEGESAWDDSYTPTIEDFHRKVYRVRSEYFKVDLLDTAGTDPFPAMRRLNILAGVCCAQIQRFCTIRFIE